MYNFINPVFQFRDSNDDNAQRENGNKEQSARILHIWSYYQRARERRKCWMLLTLKHEKLKQTVPVSPNKKNIQ